MTPKPLLLVLALSLFHTVCYCQKKVEGPTKFEQAVFTEVFGNSRSLLSINYQAAFSLVKSNTKYLSIRTGIGISPPYEDTSARTGRTSIPIVFSFLTGEEYLYWEFGVGYTATYGQAYVDNTGNRPYPFVPGYESSYIFKIGCRVMRPHGLYIEAAPDFIISNRNNSKFKWSFGFAIGGAW
jgi:hypothetical protein